EMTGLCAQYGGINLAQGFPNFAAPAAIKDAAKRAIDDDINQYAITWGAKSLRDRIAHAYEELYGMAVDPETMVTVTCGSTEAVISTLLALCEAGDEVIVLEPFYENYGPDAAIAGAVPVFVPLRPPAFAFDPDELRAAFTSRTKAIIVNTPNNPTGRVFTRAALEVIAGLSRARLLRSPPGRVSSAPRCAGPRPRLGGLRPEPTRGCVLRALRHPPVRFRR